jgi:hypothetical protein
VYACSKDFTAGPSVLCFLAGIGEVGRSEHQRTHLNDTDIGLVFFDGKSFLGLWIDRLG